MSESDPCWPGVLAFVSRENAYRLYVVLFNSTIGVLVFYNVQKTKLLQMLTTLMRWLAFTTMIVLAIKKILTNEVQPKPSALNIAAVPNFFGICKFLLDQSYTILF